MLRCLLLEDSPNDALLIARELRAVAIVDVAITGTAFKQMLGAEHWDLILIDFAIPEFSGAEAIKILKELAGDTPFIIVTGSLDHRMAGTFLRSGAADYFLKEDLLHGGEERLRHSVLNAHENHKLRRQAMRDNRLEIIGHTTAGFTHDWNNLLQAFVGGPDILRKLLADLLNPLPEPIERVLSAMESSGRRGAEMSRQLTAFVRGANGNAMRSVTPEFILTELGKILRESFPKNIQITTHTVPGTFNVKCDVTQILQLLLNLAINARDAMPHGGELHITAQNTSFANPCDPSPLTTESKSRGTPCVLIQVRDTGSGILPEHMDRVWEDFWTTKPVGHGTGLGLPMARKIARDHGGDIQLKSGPAGTIFFVYLPLAGDETRAEKVTRMEEFDGRGKTVLIVDDEAHMRLLLEIFLIDANYKPLVAINGMEALSFFRTNARIDLLLADCAMPLMSGQELARAIREQHYELPIIFLTGAADLADAAELGPVKILQKPFTRQSLLQTIKNVLQSQAI